MKTRGAHPSFNTLSGYEQGQAILKGHTMTKRWAQSFRREQSRYHRAWWTTDGERLWAIADWKEQTVIQVVHINATVAAKS